MPTQNTMALGQQESGQSGRLVKYQGLQSPDPNNPGADNIQHSVGFPFLTSESFVAQQSGSQSPVRLWLAATSGLYLIGFNMEVTSQSVAGTQLTPKVQYFSYSVGAGAQLVQAGALMDLTTLHAASTAWFMIRSAASDIFVSTSQGGSAGVPAIYNANWAIFLVSN